MVWVLIYLVIELETIHVGTMGAYSTMTECFEEREALRMTVSETEHFPINQQAICIKSDKGF